MKRRRFRLAAALAASLSLSCARAPGAADAPAGAGEVSWLDTGLGRLKATAYRSARLDGRPALAAVLHGDLLRPPPPAYHARFAQRTATRADSAAAAAILRPGHSDGEGASGGARGRATGDNQRHMKAIKGGTAWDEPAPSLSPMDVASTVPEATQVRMPVGARDDAAPPALTLAYAAALRANGVAADAAVLPGLSRDILLEPAVFDALRHLLARRDGR